MPASRRSAKLAVGSALARLRTAAWDVDGLAAPTVHVSRITDAATPQPLPAPWPTHAGRAPRLLAGLQVPVGKVQHRARADHVVVAAVHQVDVGVGGLDGSLVKRADPLVHRLVQPGQSPLQGGREQIPPAVNKSKQRWRSQRSTAQCMHTDHRMACPSACRPSPFRTNRNSTRSLLAPSAHLHRLLLLLGHVSNGNGGVVGQGALLVDGGGV